MTYSFKTISSSVVNYQTKKELLNFLRLQDSLQNIFANKSAILGDVQIIVNGNLVTVNLATYITASRVRKLNRMTKKKKKSKFSNLPIGLFNGDCSIVYDLFLLNNLINKTVVYYYLNKLQKFRRTIFKSRHRDFFDLLKVLQCMFLKRGENLKVFVIVLSHLFSKISKRSHQQFIYFVSELFRLTVINKKSFGIKGLRLQIAGRIGGRTRSSVRFIEKGRLNRNNIDNSPIFSKQYIHTYYGAFGFKCWVCY